MNFRGIAEYVALFVALVAGVYLGWKEWKERRARAGGLAPNPVRCEDHEGRIRTVEKFCSEMAPTMRSMEGDISEIKSSLNKLIEMHMKG